MDNKADGMIDERWYDYKAAVDITISDLKLDPANRFACVKAWGRYVLKITAFSMASGHAIWLIFSVVAPSEAAIPSAFGIAAGVSALAPLMIPPPYHYWRRRADSLLSGIDIPRKHKAF